jgi:hypothetical protein
MLLALWVFQAGYFNLYNILMPRSNRQSRMALWAINHFILMGMTALSRTVCHPAQQHPVPQE